MPMAGPGGRLRTLACVLLAVAMLGQWAHWKEQRHSRNFSFAASAHQWVQPDRLGGAFPQLIAPQRWSLDYAPLESRLWSRSADLLNEFASSGSVSSWSVSKWSVQLDELDALVALLPETLTHGEERRLQFLLRRSVPGPQGEAWAELLPRYARYRAALRAVTMPPKPDGRHNRSALDVAQARFLRTRELRRRYLGETWHRRLFAGQEATTRDLLQRMQAQRASR
ncbi:lipase secretion chaperone [Ketobacter sp.]|uniref:lipase secretion chaperone n=1 Tax=Ketobacter sp. TaxID=2083498 RepID=UPI000F1A6380|nr:lipase secretion chaperone [Ketobacter sp.]RLU01076.1 MAG: hypothetical protein D9N14_03750 [Ketobacter sp.]